MCGRFFQDLDEEDLREEFQLSIVEHTPAPVSRYNIGPGQPIWVVRSRPDTHERSLDALLWGLIPHFAKDRKGAYRCINARAETIARTPSYRAAFARRRCLVPARGFFEWQAEGKRKQPFAIAPVDGRPLALAGVWENWLDPSTGEWVRTVSIVTTDASLSVRALHDRMPVLIAPEHYARWLGEEPATPEQLAELLHTSERKLKTWPVSPRMNRADVEDPDNLRPVQLDQPAP